MWVWRQLILLLCVWNIITLYSLAVRPVMLAAAFLCFQFFVLPQCGSGSYTHSPSTMEAWVKSQASRCGIYCGHSDARTACAYGYFGFSLLVSLHWCSVLMHLPVTNSVWCDDILYWLNSFLCVAVAALTLQSLMPPFRAVSLRFGSVSPVIAHQFLVQCIVCTWACFAILCDSSLSNEVLCSFKLSSSFWKGKACFVYGLKFTRKQSRVGKCNARIWQHWHFFVPCILFYVRE
jgi:hypothetical protein